MCKGEWGVWRRHVREREEFGRDKEKEGFAL